MSAATLNDVFSVKAFVARYPDLGKTEKALYWDIYNSSHNGLDDYQAVIHKGRRVWIVASLYRDWMFNRSPQTDLME